MSVGNSPVELDFTSHKKNLISGANGSSKSTLVDCICFALFGKPHRAINKNQLINSVNGKNCLVEIEFSVGSINYRVVRGIKPNIFEIYQDGKLINKSADTRDYQKVLEQQILKLNYKSFTQVEILGSASFTPFMQLTPSNRRDVIEDVLDTLIYSTMNSLNKEKMAANKEELAETESLLRTAVAETEAQTKLIKSLSESKDNIITEINSKIESSSSELNKLTENLIQVTEEIAELQVLISDSNKTGLLLEECKKRIYTKESNIQSIEKQFSFFKSNSECPTCKQGIPEKYKSSVITELNTSTNNLQTENKQLKTKLIELTEKSTEIDRVNKIIQQKNIFAGGINGSIKSLQSTIKSLKDDLEKTSKQDNDIRKEKDKHSELITNGKSLMIQKSALQEYQQLTNISSAILKDSGIKSTIIKEYLPIINATINKYLDKMDFFVNFELDENFNESIKSRYRDDFSYASFSEGEKQKLDIAILLSWRHIAKLKNSINTNILFMDETLNGNLDEASVELLLDIIDDISKETNIFLITHNVDAFINRFDRVIKFEKVGNFSVKHEF